MKNNIKQYDTPEILLREKGLYCQYFIIYQQVSLIDEEEIFSLKNINSIKPFQNLSVIKINGTGGTCSSPNQHQNIQLTLKQTETDFWKSLEQVSNDILARIQIVNEPNSKSALLNNLQYIKIRKVIVEQKIRDLKNNFTILKIIHVLLESLDLVLDEYLAFQLAEVLHFFIRINLILFINEKQIIISTKEKNSLISQLNTILVNFRNQQSEYSELTLQELQMSKAGINLLPTDKQESMNLLKNFLGGNGKELINLQFDNQLMSLMNDTSGYLLVNLQHTTEQIIFQSVFFIHQILTKLLLQLQRKEKAILQTQDSCLQLDPLSFVFQLYKSFVKPCKQWEVIYEWIKLIKDITIFQPIIIQEEFTKTKFCQDSPEKQPELWKLLIRNKMIIELNNSEAILNLKPIIDASENNQIESIYNHFLQENQELQQLQQSLFFDQQKILPSYIEYSQDYLKSEYFQNQTDISNNCLPLLSNQIKYSYQNLNKLSRAQEKQTKGINQMVYLIQSLKNSIQQDNQDISLYLQKLERKQYELTGLLNILQVIDQQQIILIQLLIKKQDELESQFSTNEEILNNKVVRSILIHLLNQLRFIFDLKTETLLRNKQANQFQIRDQYLLNLEISVIHNNIKSIIELININQIQIDFQILESLDLDNFQAYKQNIHEKLNRIVLEQFNKTEKNQQSSYLFSLLKLLLEKIEGQLKNEITQINETQIAIKSDLLLLKQGIYNNSQLKVFSQTWQVYSFYNLIANQFDEYLKQIVNSTTIKTQYEFQFFQDIVNYELENDIIEDYRKLQILFENFNRQDQQLLEEQLKIQQEQQGIQNQKNQTNDLQKHDVDQQSFDISDQFENEQNKSYLKFIEQLQYSLNFQDFFLSKTKQVFAQKINQLDKNLQILMKQLNFSIEELFEFEHLNNEQQIQPSNQQQGQNYELIDRQRAVLNDCVKKYLNFLNTLNQDDGTSFPIKKQVNFILSSGILLKEIYFQLQTIMNYDKITEIHLRIIKLTEDLTNQQGNQKNPKINNSQIFTEELNNLQLTTTKNIINNLKQQIEIQVKLLKQKNIATKFKGQSQHSLNEQDKFKIQLVYVKIKKLIKMLSFGNSFDQNNQNKKRILQIYQNYFQQFNQTNISKTEEDKLIKQLLSQFSENTLNAQLDLEISQVLNDLKTSATIKSQDLQIIQYFYNHIMRYQDDNIIDLLKQQQQSLEEIEINESIKSYSFQFYERMMKLISGKNQNDQQDNWKLRFTVANSLISIEEKSSVRSISIYSGESLTKIRALETNDKIIALMKNPQIDQRMNQILKLYWQNQEQGIKEYILSHVVKIKTLQKNLSDKNNSDDKEYQLKKLKELIQEFNTIIENIIEIGLQLKIQISFLRDLQIDQISIQQNVEKIHQNIFMKQTSKFLSEKSFYQLFELRKQKVFEERIKFNLLNVYVDLFAKERDINEKLQFNNRLIFSYEEIKDHQGQYACLNEFLMEQKSCLLIHGEAGSGKSTLARRIEGFLWDRQEQQLAYQTEINKQRILVFPIFIELSLLKNPLDQAFEETLKSESYRFEECQIQELKEAVEQGEIKLIFIIDGYDEMKGNFIGKNLFQSNRFSKLKQLNDQYYPKVIFTTRTEMLKGYYRTWFCEDCNDEKLEIIKEIQIQPFNSDQKMKYLNENQMLSVKIAIFNLISLINTQQDQNKLLETFIQIWKKIEKQLTQSSISYYTQLNSETILSKQQIETILDILQQDFILTNLQKKSLTQSLLELWNVQKYQLFIRNLDLEEMIDTPLIVETVIKTLPQIEKKFDLKQMKIQFQRKFQEQEIENYENQLLKMYYREPYQPEFFQFNQQFQKNELQAILFDRKSKQSKEFWLKIQQCYQNEAQIIFDYLMNLNFFQGFSISKKFKDILQKIELILKQIPQNQSNNLNNPIELLKSKKETIVFSILTQNQTKFSLYESLIENYYDVQIKKWLDSGNTLINYATIKQDMIDFSQRLAAQLNSHNLTIVAYNKGQIYQKKKNNWKDEFFNDDLPSQNEGQLKKIIRNGLMLKQNNNRYSFNHKTIQEFLAANCFTQIYKKSSQILDANILIKLYSQLNIKQVIQQNSNEQNGLFQTTLSIFYDKIEKIMKNSTISDEILEIISQSDAWESNEPEEKNNKGRQFLKKFVKCLKIIEQDLINTNNFNNQFHQGLFSFLNEFSKQDDNFSKYLKQIIKLSKIIDFEVAASNALSILSFLQVFVGNEDFSQTNIRNANLRGLNLFNSNFSGAKLIKCDLANTNLNCTNFSGATLKDVQFGENFPLVGHTGSVQSIAISKDGSKLVSGSFDNTIRIWDIQLGIQIGKELIGHTSFVTCVTFSSDTKKVASGGGDQTARIWNSETGQQLFKEFKIKGIAQTVAFSPDGTKLVIGGGDKLIRILDTSTGELIGSEIRGHQGYITCIKFSPDGKRFLSASYDQSIKIWNLETRKEIVEQMNGHSAQVTCANFSYDGKYIVASSGDKTISVWNALNGEQIGTNIRGHTESINSVAFSPDGKKIVSASDDLTVRLWNSKSGEQIGKSAIGHTNYCMCVLFTPDGKRIISGSGDALIRIWEVAEIEFSQRRFYGHNDKVVNLTISPDGKKILSCSQDKTLRMWDIGTGAQCRIIRIPNTEAISITFSPDGLNFLTGNSDNTIRVWNSQSCEQIGPLIKGHLSMINCVVYSPDGKQIASGSDECIKIWDGQDYKLLASSDGMVKSIAYYPDGKRLVYSNYKYLCIYDVVNKIKILDEIAGHMGMIRSVAVTPDGKNIVSGSDDICMRIWDSQNGELIGKHLTGHLAEINSLAITSDGQQIVSGGGTIYGNDCVIRIWDLQRQKQIAKPIRGHSAQIQCVKISPNGKQVVSCSSDHSIIIWEWNTENSQVDQKLSQQQQDDKQLKSNFLMYQVIKLQIYRLSHRISNDRQFLSCDCMDISNINCPDSQTKLFYSKQ